MTPKTIQIHVETNQVDVSLSVSEGLQDLQDLMQVVLDVDKYVVRVEADQEAT